MIHYSGRCDGVVQMLTSGQVAELYNITGRTLGRWRKMGMPYHKFGVKAYRYERDVVLEWSKANQEVSVDSLVLAELRALLESIGTADTPLKAFGSGIISRTWFEAELLRLSDLPTGVGQDQASDEFIKSIFSMLKASLDKLIATFGATRGSITLSEARQPEMREAITAAAGEHDKAPEVLDTRSEARAQASTHESIPQTESNAPVGKRVGENSLEVKQ